MKTKPLLISLLAIAASTGIAPAQQDEKMAEPTAETTEKKDIVTIASGADDFTTLVAAVKAAGLVETLQGEEPFTVFAPTNEAFEALPEGMVVSLMEPQNQEKLKSILLYHVIPSKVMAADVAPMKVATAAGSEATVTMDGETVMIDGAKVVRTDIEASNGVIHVIDKVLIPSPAEEDGEAE